MNKHRSSQKESHHSPASASAPSTRKKGWDCPPRKFPARKEEEIGKFTLPVVVGVKQGMKPVKEGGVLSWNGKAISAWKMVKKKEGATVIQRAVVG